MTPQEIAAGVAADIRQGGHFQGGNHANTLYPHGPMCCLIANPTSKRAETRVGFDAVAMFRSALHRAIRERLGFESGLAQWSNNTPTAEVLAVLDQLAAS